MGARFMVLGIFGGNMKKAVFVIMTALSVLFVSAFSVHAQNSRMALVDLEKVALGSEKGKEARKTLLGTFDRLKKDLDARERELLSMKHAAEQEGPMALDEKSEKGKEYRRKLQDYRNLSGDYQAKIEAKDRELSENIVKEVKEVIKRTGAKDKYTLVVEKSRSDDSTIFFIDPSIDIIDISDEVLREYNNFTKTETTSAGTGAMQSVPSPVSTYTARTDQAGELKAKPTISKSKVQATKPQKAIQKKKTPEDVAGAGKNSPDKQAKEGPGDVASLKVPGTTLVLEDPKDIASYRPPGTTLVPDNPKDIASYRPFLLRRKDLADKVDLDLKKHD